MAPELEHQARLFRYEAWANAEVIEALRAGDPPKTLRWMAHIIGAGTVWLSRLRQEPPSMAVWPDLELEQCANGNAYLAAGWADYLGALGPDDLGDSLGYRNSQGEYWTSTIGDILSHVTMHGAYHRGQIAAALREAGQTPAYTDFIHATRQGLIT